MLNSSVSKIYRSWFFLLVSLVALTNGCGDSQNYVFTGTVNNPNPVVGNTLTVNLDTSAVQPRVSGDAVSFEVTLFDESLTELESVTLARGQSATFEDLPDGTYTVRVVGFDTNDDVVGFFDRRVTIGGDTAVTIPGLIYTDTVPPIGSTTEPHLVINELPDAIDGGEDFLIEATAYDVDGSPLSSFSGPATISSSPLALSSASSTETEFVNGVATFDNLQFDIDDEGNVTLSVSNPTLGTVKTPPIPVSPGTPVGTPHLVFTTVPNTGTAGQELTPNIQVQLRDAENELDSVDNVTVTLSIETGPEGGNITGDTSVQTVDGVATFTDLSVSPEGTYSFEASASGYESATSGDVVVDEAVIPFTKLAVGDYTNNRIYIYSLAALSATGNTDVAPIAVIGNDTDTLENLDLESADGGDALWFCSGIEDIALFTDINDGNDSNNNTPARTLYYSGSIASVSYDEGRDILYGAAYDDDPGSVQIWDNAFDLADEATPTREVTNFPGNAPTAVVDDASDRLFVFSYTSTADQFELHVFANASTVDGDQEQISHDVCTVTFPVDGVPYGLSYDAANDRLWIGDYDGNVFKYYFLDDVSDLGATATASVVSQDGDTHFFWDTFYDALTDTLYVSDYIEGADGHISIYENASQISGATPTVLPTRTLGGSNSLLEGPDGITLLP